MFGVENKWVMDTNDFDFLEKKPKNHNMTLASSVKLTMDVAVDQSEEVRMLPLSEAYEAIRALYLAFVAHDQLVANPSSIVVHLQGAALLDPSQQAIFLLSHVVSTLASHIEDIFIGGKGFLGCNEETENILPPYSRSIKALCDVNRDQQLQAQITRFTLKVRNIEIAPSEPASVEATAHQLLLILGKLHDMAEAHVGIRPARYAYPRSMGRLRRAIVVASWHLAHLDIPVTSVALLRHQLLVAHDIMHLKNPPVSNPTI